MSDRITVAGVVPALSGPEVEENLREGANTTYTWEGTKAEVDALRDNAVASGATRVVRAPSSGGNWKITVTYAGTPNETGGPQADLPTNLHELTTTVEQIPWQKSAQLRTFFNASRADEIIGTVSSYVNKYNSGDINATATLSSYAVAQQNLSLDLAKISGTTAGEIVDAKKLLKQILVQGVGSAVEYNSSYSRSITAATFTQVKAAYTGVGKIWTSSEVEAFEGIPTEEWFGLDPSLIWLKSPPNVQAAYNGKTQISYNYTGAKQASKFFWAAYGSATLID
jgi:hypothetical protein